jgi:hypothetical protein
MQPQLTTTYEGTWFTHRVLWQIAEEQADVARQRDRGWVNVNLVAVTFAFHALEAYINVAGENLAPALWANERKSFRGWQHKLKKVLELSNVPWQDDARPLKTVLELQELRNYVAHGKAERFQGTLDHHGDPDVMVPMPSSRILSAIASKDTLEKIFEDVRALIEAIHPAVATVTTDHFLKATAIGGTSVWMTRATTLKK